MSKRLRNSVVCADCGVSEPRWASLNRGVLICDECCGVHRGLGRHSSQIRHLSKAPWPPTQLQMVQTLYNNGSNSIWEHSLTDPSSAMSVKRKANTLPNKTDFIKAKYEKLAFVHRPLCREEDGAAELSKELHSSVRAGNLETSLRLLSLGAQANFFYLEKGNTPLHIAARAGQLFQVELLAVYGADPGALDAHGKTPIDCAREAEHHNIADRLVEIQYEFTDRLAFYLCGKRPDHKNGQHFIIPVMKDGNVTGLSDLAKAAKKQLHSLSDHLFEELAMDVYDEVDRRETDAVWHANQSHANLFLETAVVPFLPVNPEYSAMRNQGRQKLARFSAEEFATLVFDILCDAKFRQQGCPEDNLELILKNIAVPENDQLDLSDDTDHEQQCSHGDQGQNSDSSDLSEGAVTVQEFMKVKRALSGLEAKVQQLLVMNTGLSDELQLMKAKVPDVCQEQKY